MILLYDNYDSFTYNLYQMLIEWEDVLVLKNDQDFEPLLSKKKFSRIVLSPGPGLPEQSGGLMALVHKAFLEFPLLGVCLGHQALGIHFGAKLRKAKDIFHGRASLVYHQNQGIFQGIPCPFQVIRYHSWLIDERTIPQEIEVTAWTEAGEIMGIQKKDASHISGVQFHPESILSHYGINLLRNFMQSRVQ